MKATLLALFVALLMVGCGEEAQKKAVQEEAKDDPSVPLAIPCVACGEKVSKKTTECRQCGHPTPDSVVVYKKAQELARRRAVFEIPDPTPGGLESPSFNAEPPSRKRPRANPTRPEPGEIIVPGQILLVPAPLPPIENPGPINLASTDVMVYKVQRGDTLWAIARKNNVSLVQLLTGNPSLDKNSRLAIGQEIILPAGGSSVTQPGPVSPSVSVPLDGSSYVVKPGDSLSRIAGSQGVSLNALFQANGLTKSSIIRPGQVLTIPGRDTSAVVPSPSPTVVPVGALTHVVKKGDNLARISAIYGTTAKQIMEWNNLADAGKISIGQNLVVSDPSTVPSAPQTTKPGIADPDLNLEDFFKDARKAKGVKR